MNLDTRNSPDKDKANICSELFSRKAQDKRYLLGLKALARNGSDLPAQAAW